MAGPLIPPNLCLTFGNHRRRGLALAVVLRTADKNDAAAANLHHLRITRRNAEFGRIRPFDCNRYLIGYP